MIARHPTLPARFALALALLLPSCVGDAPETAATGGSGTAGQGGGAAGKSGGGGTGGTSQGPGGAGGGGNAGTGNAGAGNAGTGAGGSGTAGSGAGAGGAGGSGMAGSSAGAGGAGAAGGPACTSEGAKECQQGKAAVCTSGQWVQTSCTAQSPVCVLGECKQCLTGELACDGNAPKECVNGAWQLKAACDAAKACTNGTCASVSGSGGISVGAVPGGSNTKLGRGGLQGLRRICGPGGTCVSGGFR